MALRLHGQAWTRRIFINNEVAVRLDQILSSLARIRQRSAAAGLYTRADECIYVERVIRSGRRPTFSPWLQRELLAEYAPDRIGTRALKTSDGNGVRGPNSRTTDGSNKLVPTYWQEWCPQAPESPLLPPLSDALLRDINSLDLGLDDSGYRWIRWASLHSSYLNESIPDSPVSTQTLALLAQVGTGWLRTALLDRVRAQRGEFTSNAGVSGVLAASKQARTALGKWVMETSAGHFSRGERRGLTPEGRSSAPVTVAMQILGALCVVTASRDPVERILELLSFELREPEPDWFTLLQSQVKAPIHVVRSESGPDNDKKHTITIEIGGRSVSSTAPSVKEARRSAAKTYIRQYLPQMVQVVRRHRAPTGTPRQLPGAPPKHRNACRWLQQTFHVSDAGLFTQALIHRSWVYENRDLVARANQRDYGVIATEGSEVLTNLVRHHYALEVLNKTTCVPESVDVAPAISREIIAKWFDTLPVKAGLLRSRGMPIGMDVKGDVVQAIIGATWRFHGDLLIKRQPKKLADWINSYSPPRNSAIVLHNYCAQHFGSAYSVEYEGRGPQHNPEFRATITLDVVGRPTCTGEWRPTHAAASQSAADNAIRLLLGDNGANSPQLDEQSSNLLRAALLAEIRAVDQSALNPAREIANGRLAVDLLVAARFEEYQDWAHLRSRVLSSLNGDITRRLTEYYRGVLTQQRRRSMRAWVIGNLPTRGADDSDGIERVAAWWQSDRCARLALLEDLLTTVDDTGFIDGVFKFVERHATTVAKMVRLELESARNSDQASDTLTLRISGAEFVDAFDPIIDVVDTTGAGIVWTRCSDSLSLSIPRIPESSDSLARIGLGAVEYMRNDPGLLPVRDGLHALLKFVEDAMRCSGGIEPVHLDAITDQERNVLSRL